MLKLSWIVLVLLVFWTPLSGQRVKGSWKDHLSYTQATKIAIGDNRVYTATEGGILFVDLSDNSMGKLSDQENLSDFGVKTLAYSSDNKVLVIAYDNSNIDLFFESGVINIPDIQRKQLTGDKTINNISFNGNNAYISCGFGIVVLNLEKREVKDTYFIGDDGSMLGVNDVVDNGSFIYAATNEGLRVADKTGANLLDYRNWIPVTNIPNSNSKFSHLEIHAGKILANYTPEKWAEDKIYVLEGENWVPYNPQLMMFAKDMQSANNYLLISSRNEVIFVDENHSVAGSLNEYNFNGERIYPIHPLSAGLSADGNIWVADEKNSLVKAYDQTTEKITPPGPMDNEIFSVYHTGEKLWVAPGGRTDAWNNTFQRPRFQYMQNDAWKFFERPEYPELDGFFDVVQIVEDPMVKDHIFVATWGGGVLEYQNEDFIARYTNKNSPLESALPQVPDEPFVRIGGLAFDSDGNLWIVNSEVANNLLKLSPSGDWETFDLPGIPNNRTVGQVVVTDNDDKWIVVPRGNDAYVVDQTGDRKKRLLVTSYFSNGTDEVFTRMNDIYSIVVDLEGAVWMGTSKGVIVYTRPSRIWDVDVLYGNQPGLDLNDGIYHPLLETETVTAIAVDGANRKWMGTKNSGIFLISEDGDKEIEHFTAENSPLLSNQITSIDINQKSGEVFIGTDEGLIAYQGDATAGANKYADVYVYPNPVREHYDGPITITGLIEETDIKITDISGNLVFNTTSLGGDAVWDGTNLNGNRVKTGVYLVFCNDKNGEETHIEKLLFIH